MTPVGAGRAEAKAPPPRPAVRRAIRSLRTDGFAFDVEVLRRARRLGFRVTEVPVRWNTSSASRPRLVRDYARMLGEILRMRGIQ